MSAHSADGGVDWCTAAQGAPARRRDWSRRLAPRAGEWRIQGWQGRHRASHREQGDCHSHALPHRPRSPDAVPNRRSRAHIPRSDTDAESDSRPAACAVAAIATLQEGTSRSAACAPFEHFLGSRRPCDGERVRPLRRFAPPPRSGEECQPNARPLIPPRNGEVAAHSADGGVETRHHHIRNTPNLARSSIGALRHAANASPSTSRVCAGSMMPSSHSRAVACQGDPCAS